MCEELEIDGDRIVVCGLRAFKKFCECGRPAEALCDWKVAARKSGTCDRPICSRHAKQVAPGKHLCPEHQGEYDDWKARNPPAQGSLFQEAA
jgi:hypothetical protein